MIFLKIIKHIDMSAQPFIVFLIANIFDESYQADAFSEIEKANSHNNEAFVVTNNFDNRFDNTEINFLKIPSFVRCISIILYLIIFNNLLK